MRISTTLSTDRARVLTSCPEAVTAFCWHPVKAEAFAATRKGIIYRLDAVTGGIIGSWGLTPSHVFDVVDSNDEKDEDSVVPQLFCTSYREGRFSTKACLVAMTLDRRLFTWDLSQAWPLLIREATLARNTFAPASVSATIGLDCSYLVGLSPTRQAHVHLLPIEPRHVKAKPGAFVKLEPKTIRNVKKLFPTFVSACPGLGCIAVGMDDGSFCLWRFKQDFALDEESNSIQTTSFLASPLLSDNIQSNSIASMSWGDHDGSTKLLLTCGTTSSEATLWAWSANFRDDTDAGSLSHLRSFPSFHPKSFACLHPQFPLAILLCHESKDEFVQSSLAVVDLETGTITNEPFMLQRRNLAYARPPAQSKPKPPPLKIQVTGNSKAKPEALSVDKKRRKSLFSFTPSFKRKINEPVEISSPLPPPSQFRGRTQSSMSGALEPQAAEEIEGDNVHIERQILVSPVTGMIVIVERSLDPSVAPLVLFTRDVTLTFESSFIGSVSYPIVASVDPTRSLLRVALIPQNLNKLPVNANGAPLFETALERITDLTALQTKPRSADIVILKRIQTSAITITNVDERAGDPNDAQIIVRACGHIGLLPRFGHARNITFEPASDACFYEKDKVAVLTGRAFVGIKRFDEGKQSWERSSMKIRLQLDVRRVFSTPWRAGGSYMKEGGSEGTVLLYCGMLASSTTEFLCYSRNAVPRLGSEDLFMLIPDGLVEDQSEPALQPPTPQPQRGGKATPPNRSSVAFDFVSPRRRNSQQSPRESVFFGVNVVDSRAGSVAISMKDMEDLKKRQDSLSRKIKAGEITPTSDMERGEEEAQVQTDLTTAHALECPMITFERGERVLSVSWSPFKPRLEKGETFSLWTLAETESRAENIIVGEILVQTTRRIAILTRTLEVVAEVRESPTSAVFIAPGTVAFTCARTPDQVFVLSSIGEHLFEATPLLSVPRDEPGEGPAVLVAALPEALVMCRVMPGSRGIKHFARLYFPPARMLDSSDFATGTRLNVLASMSHDGDLTRLKGVADECLDKKFPLTAQTMLDIARVIPTEKCITGLRHHERFRMRLLDPEFTPGSLSNMLQTQRENHEAELVSGRVILLESSGMFWAAFKECVAMISDDPSQLASGKKHLLGLAKKAKGTGAGGLMEAIRVIVGTEALNEILQSSNAEQQIGHTPRSQARARDDSIASQAADRASSRSDQQHRSLRRRETIPHPAPSFQQHSSLPLSSEGEILFDTNEVDSQLRQNADVPGFHHTDEDGCPMTIGEWFCKNPIPSTLLDLWPADSLTYDFGSTSRVTDFPVPEEKSFEPVRTDLQARKYSFGGSDENACVGYFRFEEDVDESNLCHDLSRCENHARIVGENVTLEDSAESCNRMEIGGRRHPRALRVDREGGIDIPLTSSTDLGPHQEDASKQSFTLEFWTRMDDSCSLPAVLCERIADEFLWRFVLTDDFTLVVQSPDVVCEMRLNVGRWRDGEWRHIALVFTTPQSEGEGIMKIYVNGQAGIIDMKQQDEDYDEADDDDAKAIRVGGSNLTAEFLEIRLWAVAREQWEISSMMETYLNLADRVAVRLNSKISSSSANSRAQPSEQNALTDRKESLGLSPPPPSFASKRKESLYTTQGSLEAKNPPSSAAKTTVESPIQPSDQKTISNPFEIDDPFADMASPAVAEPSGLSWDYKDPQMTSPFDPFSSMPPSSSVHHAVERRSVDEDPILEQQPPKRSSVVKRISGMFSDALTTQQSQQTAAKEEMEQTNGDPWRKYVDPETGTDYFFNVITQQSVWTDPRVSDSVWDKFTDENGDVYYYNRETGETTWDDPDSQEVTTLQSVEQGGRQGATEDEDLI